MAAITGLQVNNRQFNGVQGNAAVWSGYNKMGAVASTVTDTLDLLTIPAGAKVNDFKVAWTAHGGAGTLSFGWRYKDGTTGGTATAFLGATSSVAAGSASNVFVTPDLTALGTSGNSSGIFDKDIIVYATSAATLMPANMEIEAHLSGEFRGTL